MASQRTKSLVSSAAPKFNDGLECEMTAPRLPSSWRVRGSEWHLNQMRQAALRQARREGLGPDDAEDAASRWLLEVLHQEARGIETPKDAAYLRFASGRFVRRDAADTEKRARRELCFSAGNTDDVDGVPVEAPDLTWEGARAGAFWNALLVALSCLSPDQRQAIVWRHLDEEAVPTIAERLNRSEEATRQLLHRARLNLRAPLLEWSKKLLLLFCFLPSQTPASLPLYKCKAELFG